MRPDRSTPATTGGLQAGQQLLAGTGAGLGTWQRGQRGIGLALHQAVQIQRPTGFRAGARRPMPPKGCTPTTAPTTLRFT